MRCVIPGILHRGSGRQKRRLAEADHPERERPDLDHGGRWWRFSHLRVSHRPKSLISSIFDIEVMGVHLGEGQH